jgi:hypothetical protein
MAKTKPCEGNRYDCISMSTFIAYVTNDPYYFYIWPGRLLTAALHTVACRTCDEEVNKVSATIAWMRS